jgi:hypothetical protein
MNAKQVLQGASASVPGVMDVFELHRHLIADYAAYTKSFIRIRDARIRQAVESHLRFPWE